MHTGAAHDGGAQPFTQCRKQEKDDRMRLAVLKENRPAEARVAATADTVKKLVALGLTVAVETGAGTASAVSDADFRAAGAEIAADAATALADAGIVFAVQMPDAATRALIPRGA